jgi:hypothetical protein
VLSDNVFLPVAAFLQLVAFIVVAPCFSVPLPPTVRHDNMPAYRLNRLRDDDARTTTANIVFKRSPSPVDCFSFALSGGNNGVVRRGRCGAQSAVLGPEGRDM